jgi:predicted permease
MMMDSLSKDVTHTWRMMRRNPAFSLAALAALTLGIGANVAIFSVVNAVLLRPVDAVDPDRIVVFMNTTPQGSGPAASPAKFAHWRAQTDVVRDVSAFRTGIVNDTTGSLPEQLRSAQVSADFFRLFGAPFARGRGFTAAEDAPDGPRVVVLSHEFWVTRFGSDPAALGRTLSLGGVPHEIVGILGDFSFREYGPPPQVWTPFQLDPATSDQGHYFTAAGRLRDGVTVEQAAARLDASSAAYRQRFPDALQPNASFTVQSLGDVLVLNVRTSLLVLAGAVTLVLLIACANVANLLLARSAAREREMAVRAAVGGSRARLVRQLVTESVLLALAGGAAGLVFGILSIRALLAINTAGLPRVGEDGALVSVDWRVAGFSVLLSVLTGLLFGLAPALQASRTDLTTALKEGGRSGTGFRQARVRSLLVIAEVALALVLVIGSALLIRTALQLTRVDPGFDATNVLTARMSLSGPRSESSLGVAQLVRSGIEHVEAIPGVENASASCCVPLQGGFGLPFVIAGRPLEGPFHGGGGWISVSPGYFEVFRIPVKRGRSFTDQDVMGNTPVVIVNEAMAREFWPEGDPLTARITIGKGVMREFSTESERQIIGIVGDTRDGGLNNDPQPTMYVPQAQVPDAANALNAGLAPMAWVVRTRVPVETLSPRIQEELRKATGFPVATVRSMSDVVSLSTSRERFNMWLMTIFGASSLLLAAIGIYGLMAYSVAQRRREIGIRLALGAQRAQVRRLVVGEGLRLAVIGGIAGLAAGLGLARYLGSFLFQVSPRDPLAFIAAPLLLMAVAALAVWIPAERASRVSPIVALRDDVS